MRSSPGTRVSVVNSDPAADDRPLYKPTLDPETGKWRPARDLSTIFVSGNVMARGLTLEGMTTALFQRSSANPLADTQMQMQRWFGYRGAYIELCRVFADPDQLDLFRAYHDMDEAVRVAITEKMVGGDAPRPGGAPRHELPGHWQDCQPRSAATEPRIPAVRSADQQRCSARPERAEAGRTLPPAAVV